MKALTTFALLAALVCLGESAPGNDIAVEIFDRSIMDPRAFQPPTVPLDALRGFTARHEDILVADNDSRLMRRSHTGKLAARRAVEVSGVGAADAFHVLLEERGSSASSSSSQDENCDDGTDDTDDTSGEDDCDEDDASSTSSSCSATDTPSGTSSSSSSVQEPSNIAPETFTPSDGCTSYYTPIPGDDCLSVVANTSLTLDQFYCLNPDINQECFNLFTGMAYCTGFGGTWPSD